MKNPDQKKQSICLPFWRPGRYERGDFAKKIQKFNAYNEGGHKLSFTKSDGHTWEIETNGAKELKLSYNFYATDLNAGSTYVDKGFLYVNPVNLCMYPKGKEDEACELKLETEEGLQVFGSMPSKKGDFYQFDSFHSLADTPFFCCEADNVSSLKFEEGGVPYTLHFWGFFELQSQQILRDFKKFVRFTVAQFPEQPFEQYQFLFLCMPNRFHHGVEHKNSTVIALGPGHDLFTSDYDEFLSISCHELYHAWNVKSIRPIEFWPYRYNEESYSNLGYLCEGVTTYLGNLLLLQSGVWTFESMASVFEKFLDRHFHNFGRFNQSVAQSSFETWLDGYERGIPDRKVSIYNEGALITFCVDCIIRKKHGGEKSIHDVMRKLYTDFYQKGLGVSEQDYWNTIAFFAGDEAHEFAKKYVFEKADYSSAILEAFEYLGLEFEAVPSHHYHEASLGIRLHKNADGHGWQVTHIYPSSPAEEKGMCVGDNILSVNEIEALDDFPKWLKFFESKELHFFVKRNGFVKRLAFRANERIFYKEYKVSRHPNPSRLQREAYNKWSCK